MKRFWKYVTGNKRRKFVAFGATMALAAGAFAFVTFVTSGSGSGSETLGSNPNQQAVTLSASWDPSQVTAPGPAPAGGTCTVQGMCTDVAFKVDNPNPQAATIRTLTVTGVTSDNATCDAGIQRALSGDGGDATKDWFALGFTQPGGNPAGSPHPDDYPVHSFTLDTPFSVPANATGFNLDWGGFKPNFIWIDDQSNDQSSCYGSKITVNLTSTS
jgi:hypothetical protein